MTDPKIHADSARKHTSERRRARRRLEQALAEQSRLGRRYELCVGTTSELGAYVELRRAGDRVAACDRWCRWVEEEEGLAPPLPEHDPLETLA